MKKLEKQKSHCYQYITSYVALLIYIAKYFLDIIQHTQTEAFPMPKDASNYLSYFTHVVFKPIGVKLQYPAQLIHETSQY